MLKGRIKLVVAVIVGWVFLTASVVAVTVPLQNFVQGIYFTDTGGNNATASIVYTRDSSDNPVWDAQFGTSDTNAFRAQASGFTFYEDFDSIIIEGSTDDGNEVVVEWADPQADYTFNWRSDLADTYHPLTQPDGDVTGGVFISPAVGGDDVVTTSGDNVMLCQVTHLPMWLTVANVYLRGVVGADSGSDDTISFAIYENADAGVQLTEATGSDLAATANVTLNVTDVTLGPGMYRMCGCAQDVSGAAFHAATLDDETIDVLNIGSVTFGTAANACVSGNPPDTTGSLTTADDNMIVFKLGA